MILCSAQIEEGRRSHPSVAPVAVHNRLAALTDEEVCNRSLIEGSDTESLRRAASFQQAIEIGVETTSRARTRQRASCRSTDTSRRRSSRIPPAIGRTCWFIPDRGWCAKGSSPTVVVCCQRAVDVGRFLKVTKVRSVGMGFINCGQVASGADVPRVDRTGNRSGGVRVVMRPWGVTSREDLSEWIHNQGFRQPR